jgi:hypothetical protein
MVSVTLWHCAKSSEITSNLMAHFVSSGSRHYRVGALVADFRPDFADRPDRNVLNCWTGSAPSASTMAMNSITSMRRSPPSYLATKDCGFPSFLANACCRMPPLVDQRRSIRDGFGEAAGVRAGFSGLRNLSGFGKSVMDLAEAADNGITDLTIFPPFVPGKTLQSALKSSEFGAMLWLRSKPPDN